ncbi:MAG: hypothetical protein WC783_05415 [Candidatus Paceibacterota bacterium]|jgi:hypothetical protein
MLGNHKPYRIEPFMGKGMKGKFETLSWQIGAGHAISLAVLKHALEIGEITQEQFDDLLDKRIKWVQAKQEEATRAGNQDLLVVLSKEMKELNEQS